MSFHRSIIITFFFLHNVTVLFYQYIITISFSIHNLIVLFYQSIITILFSIHEPYHIVLSTIITISFSIDNLIVSFYQSIITIMFITFFLYPISNISLNTSYRKYFYTIHISYHSHRFIKNSHTPNIWHMQNHEARVNIKYNHGDTKVTYLIDL